MEQVELFIHSAGRRPQVVVAAITETLRAVLAREDVLPGDGQHVFIGEVVMAIEDPESDEDLHEPVEIDLTIAELNLPQHKHIHTKTCRRVIVTVFFNGVHHTRRFSPAVTVATTLAWAKKRFKIDGAAGANLILELEPGHEHPPLNQHLGELLKPGQHELKFKLVAEITPQG